MLATAVSGALAGIDGLLVEVEVDVALGLPQFATGAHIAQAIQYRALDRE